MFGRGAFIMKRAMLWTIGIVGQTAGFAASVAEAGCPQAAPEPPAPETPVLKR
jgi:hypothetical protein